MADGSNGIAAQPIVEKMEYDAAIGGSHKLPNDLSTFNYGHQFMSEINALTLAVQNPNSTKLVFQKLPKHMRRRAMSHHPNRLPRKLRMVHRAQMVKSGVPAQSKRPSRKYRRKPVNLLQEYQRRQRKCAWLETHIWHAKRFHMVDKWGYKLAESSCDKTFRSSYRASVRHCLIQDISFMGCIEVRGPLDVLRSGFVRIRGAGTGLGICAKAYLNGQREGSAELFAIDSYPEKAFGRVQFMWKRKCDTDSQHRIWFFVHPSIHSMLVEEFCKLFGLEQVIVQRAAAATLEPKQFSNATKSIEMYDLKQYLNRFRLTGPLSHAIVQAALKPKVHVQAADKTWFADHLRDRQNADLQERSVAYWNAAKQAATASDLPTNAILSLNVEDPRINRPKKRTKAIGDDSSPISAETQEALLALPANSGDSILWSFAACDRIKCEKVSTHVICALRNKNILVPGERCSFENELQPVPIVLIQRPGSRNPRRLGYGGGYDVIIPSGYGVSTWMCLIMWGARPGALRETETIAREAMEDEFPPDTEAGRINANALESDLRKKYFRKPPNKRRNYMKLSVASPFKCPWEQLVTEWKTEATSTDFHVLRDQQRLGELDQILSGRKSAAMPTIDERWLIPVAVEMNGRGMCNRFSMICLPTQADLANNRDNLKSFSYAPVWTEPPGHDPHEHRRKQSRAQHVMLLKRLRRRRVRTKRKQQEYSERKVIIAPAKTAKLIESHRLKMCQLWLPPQPASIRNQCSREVLGYLTLSQFSLHAGKVIGVGYVTANALRQLAQLRFGGKANQVLVRDPDSLQYRLATLSIRSY